MKSRVVAKRALFLSWCKMVVMATIPVKDPGQGKERRHSTSVSPLLISSCLQQHTDGGIKEEKLFFSEKKQMFILPMNLFSNTETGR